jgi:steroid Delta-isomerase
MSSIETTIQTYFDAIRRKDAETWAACFAPDGVAYDPADAPPRQGTAAHRAFFEGVASLFTDLDFRPHGTYVCGNEAAVPFVACCVAKNGKAVEVEGVDIFQFDADGRVKCVKGYWDPAPLFAAAARTEGL